MRHISKKRIVLVLLLIIVLFVVLHPVMNRQESYEHIEKENLLKSLHEEVSLNYSSTAVAECEYYETVYDETTLPFSLVNDELVNGHRIKEGGQYTPTECKPKFSTAIIVPYRDRAEQLHSFLVYMHMFLRRQNIHYRIYVVEQVDTLPFNRGKLLNIGSVTAMKAGFPCLVLHNVNLLPLRPANLYACTNQPRHMSSSINKFRFVLPYMNLFGGAVSIQSKQYRAVNGMSNEYYGRGGEDDELYSRLKARQMKVCRFQSDTSQYHVVTSPLVQGRGKTKSLLFNAKSRMETDGLSSLKYIEVATVPHPLFTHIMVDV